MSNKNKYSEKMSSLGSYFVQDGTPKILTENDLIKIEDEVGFNLSDNYREFLSDFGCFAPDGYAVFSFKESFPKGDKGIVDVFYGISGDDVYDLLYNYEIYKDRIGQMALPIAQDPGSNQICLILAGSERGKIYFWFHGEELLGKSNLYLIANSFDEFINSLKLEE